MEERRNIGCIQTRILCKWKLCINNTGVNTTESSNILPPYLEADDRRANVNTQTYIHTEIMKTILNK